MATPEEDGYSDHDLDALASEDFLELQEQALHATQHRDAPHQLQPLLLRGQPISQSEIDQVTKGAPTTLPRLPPPGHQPQASRVAQDGHKTGAPRRSAHNQALDEATQREQWRLQRFGTPSAAPYRGPAPSSPQRKTFAHRPASQEGVQASRHIIRPEAAKDSTQRLGDSGFKHTNNLETNMQQLILDREQWMSEKASLERTLMTASEQLQARNGEIAILRSSHAKQVSDRDRHLEDLQRQQRVLDERHRSELEQIRREKEKLVVQNRFLDHENNDRSFHSKPSRKAKGLVIGEGTSTPRRPKAGFGDGFEDNELELISPSKAASRPKASTPKAGAKRKRDTLYLSPFEAPVVENESFSATKPSPRGDVRPPHTLLSSSLLTQSDLLHRLLFHRERSHGGRVFETLSSYQYPSHTISFSEIFMEKLPPSVETNLEDAPASIGLVLVEIWSKCLSERFYMPTDSLMAALRFVLDNGSFTTAVRLMDDIVSLAQRTADINVIPRFKKLNKNAKVISVHLDDHTMEDDADVDTKECLELLYAMALSCARDYNAMTRFWHCMRFDFISMLLRVVQPIEDIVLMVRLLQTCAEQDCFGAIKPPSPEGGSAEQHVIDRLSSMLIETPRSLDENAPYDMSDILGLRLTILRLIEKMCEQKLCSHAFATHPLALGRLVRLMSDELNAIYAGPYCQSSRSEIIDRSVRILFYLMSTYSSEIDLQDKLRRQPGGVNKFLITLSRLAFSDAVWYERGIGEDAFDCAHQLLEDFVTPEEAVALKKAFVKDDV